MVSVRDLALVRRAKKHRTAYTLRIIMQARESGIPISLGFAVVEQESGFRNVFGHDPTKSIPDSWKGTRVTKSKYKYYKQRREVYGMQGVGPCQLTWYEYQDEADRRGGCWIPKHNISVAFDRLAVLFKTHQTAHQAIKAYNGAGPAAEGYANTVQSRERIWHSRLS